MRAPAMYLLVATCLAGVFAAPGAAALDAFPDHDVLGEREARLLVRLPRGGTLHVEADAPVEVALAAPGGAPEAFAQAPAAFEVAGARTWRGLSGVVEVVLRRDDPSRPVFARLEDGDGAGLEVEWPAASAAPAPRDVPAPPLAGVVGAAAGAALLRRTR